MTTVASVRNYEIPPISFQEIAEILTSAESGQSFSYGNNTTNALFAGFCAQSCIVDGRNLNKGENCKITFSNSFSLNILPGMYKAFIIPAYEQTSFVPIYNGAVTSSCMIRLFNFQMLPCQYN